MVVIETERLYLRELTTGDIDSLSTVLSDPESMRYYPHPFSRNEVEKWIDWNISNYREHGFGLWGVITKAENQFIGDCGITIQDIEGEKLPEIGYHIRKEYRNKGMATEAAKACCEYGFKHLNMPQIVSYMDKENRPSRRVAEKVGMSFQKKFLKEVYGKEVIEVLYVVRNPTIIST